MITVVTKNRRIPNVLIDGGLGFNIMKNALRKKLGLTNIGVAPFRIKMVDQRKVVPVCLIRDLKIDVGGVKKKMTSMVIDLSPTDNNYEMMLGKTWFKQLKQSMSGALVKLPSRIERKEIVMNVQRTPAVPTSKRVLA